MWCAYIPAGLGLQFFYAVSICSQPRYRQGMDGRDNNARITPQLWLPFVIIASRGSGVSIKDKVVSVFLR